MILIEFSYNPKDDATTAYIFTKDRQLIDRKEFPGTLSGYMRRTIRKELMSEYKR